MKAKKKDVFDRQLAMTLRDAAVARVSVGASKEWLRAAFLAVTNVAASSPQFTTDRVWYVLQLWGAEGPAEPRAMGPVMRSAVVALICEPTDRYVLSVRTACHRRPIRVYRSLQCGPVPVLAEGPR